MAKKTKARIIPVRLISMAMTGFFYTFRRPRQARPMSMMKYDPIETFDINNPSSSTVRKHVLFLESKKRIK
ncbi:hypothetical protein TD95_001396 [Thielaviopsis punctulata]|uniref:Large ribosomal subunit protein bL33m n=1 Tax=Thielaviopsis punctulata TaxID=72032 RepID=A0A0F4Z7S1_9PEZI|nr:hypothetical protein TD95_001396 [Thielaviopsis punctulata]